MIISMTKLKKTCFLRFKWELPDLMWVGISQKSQNYGCMKKGFLPLNLLFHHNPLYELNVHKSYIILAFNWTNLTILGNLHSREEILTLYTSLMQVFCKANKRSYEYVLSKTIFPTNDLGAEKRFLNMKKIYVLFSCAFTW